MVKKPAGIDAALDRGSCAGRQAKPPARERSSRGEFASTIGFVDDDEGRPSTRRFVDRRSLDFLAAFRRAVDQ